jgi:hypothetical protein
MLSRFGSVLATRIGYQTEQSTSSLAFKVSFNLQSNVVYAFSQLCLSRIICLSSESKVGQSKELYK